MLSRGDNLGVGGEQDVEAKALRSVRWYARRWREKLSQKWLQSCRKMPPPPQAAGHPTLRDGSTSNGTSAEVHHHNYYDALTAEALKGKSLNF